MVIDVPSGSIYMWMYQMGLRHVDFTELRCAISAAGKIIRKKDEQNYWNGWYNSDLYHSPAAEDIWLLRRKRFDHSSPDEFFTRSYNEYDPHPYNGMAEVEERWVPCSAGNKPLIKWSSGCLSIADAKAYTNSVYLGENLKGTNMIVIDCDGDHGDKLDLETIMFLRRWADKTHCLDKPKRIEEYEGYEDTGLKIPASFHLTFTVDKIIPTMHFPYAGIDIVGNRRNSLRYWKNKKWNGMQPVPMDYVQWEQLKHYIKYRKEIEDGNISARHAKQDGIQNDPD